MPFDDQNKQTVAFEAYMCTDEGAAVAKSVLSETGKSMQSLHGGGLSGAARLLSETEPGTIVLAELGLLSISMACECVEELRRANISVIVLGTYNDLATYRALRHAGALDYYPFPVSAQDILSASLTPAPPPSPAVVVPGVKHGLSIGVIGCKGGVGASLLAQNLAAYASAPKGARRRTALLDADLEFGSQAIDLDRDETRGIFDALSAPSRVDRTFLSATMEHLSDTLSFYSGQVRAEQNAHTYEPGIKTLVPRLREEFETVIADLPRGTVMRQPDLIGAFDKLILVLPAGFAGVNAASRLMAQLRNDHPDFPVLTVLSDIRQDAGLPVKDIETTLNITLTATLPSCAAALAKAHKAAKPLVALQPRSPWAKAVRGIWDQAQQAPADAPKQRKKRKGLFG
ncbi:MAG: hypothetical protein RID11_02410 [Roseovarius sp.]|jgi:pilus assembly protein CpaE|uniref:AAA family ATPase n=1 Tax=Roseovarius sp. TaxID=1486281 RepID=UPI0032EB274A